MFRPPLMATDTVQPHHLHSTRSFSLVASLEMYFFVCFLVCVDCLGLWLVCLALLVLSLCEFSRALSLAMLSLAVFRSSKVSTVHSFGRNKQNVAGQLARLSDSR